MRARILTMARPPEWFVAIRPSGRRVVAILSYCLILNSRGKSARGIVAAAAENAVQAGSSG